MSAPAAPAKRNAAPVALRPVDAAASQVTPAAILQVLSAGDLSELSDQDRVQLYVENCQALGLNWRTKPFTIAKTKGGAAALYLTADGAEQLAALHEISVEQINAQETRGVYMVTMKATAPNGRSVTKTGGKPIGPNVAGEAFIDAVKKAETQAYRRAVKACVGLNTYDPERPRPVIEAAEITEAIAAGLLEQVTVEHAADPAANGEPPPDDAGDVEEATFRPIAEPSPVRVAKGRLWKMAEQRGITSEIEVRALAALMGVELAVATTDELNHLTQQLIDNPDAKQLLAESGMVARLQREAAEDPMTSSDSHAV